MSALQDRVRQTRTNRHRRRGHAPRLGSPRCPAPGVEIHAPPSFPTASIIPHTDTLVAHLQHKLARALLGGELGRDIAETGMEIALQASEFGSQELGIPSRKQTARLLQRHRSVLVGILSANLVLRGVPLPLANRMASSLFDTLVRGLSADRATVTLAVGAFVGLADGIGLQGGGGYVFSVTPPDSSCSRATVGIHSARDAGVVLGAEAGAGLRAQIGWVFGGPDMVPGTTAFVECQLGHFTFSIALSVNTDTNPPNAEVIGIAAGAVTGAGASVAAGVQNTNPLIQYTFEPGRDRP